MTPTNPDVRSVGAMSDDSNNSRAPTSYHEGFAALVRSAAIQSDALQELTNTVRDLRATHEKTLDAMRMQASIIEYLREELRKAQGLPAPEASRRA